ncbi:unnamed protein product [Vicia faba]|uniref:Uncharacterized protein n=1 Tax=Vicia faba TaxID=3906 RepID=A0AAV1BCZ3_VICFA|nr:unnamed protein product [Vicia faba]
MERLKEKVKGHVNVEENEDGEDNKSSEDSLNGIHFEDNEEERMHDFDEDMGEGAGTSGMDNGDGTCQMDNGQGIHKGLTTTEMQREHVIEDDYITYELDSGTDDDSDDGRPLVIRFNEHENLRKEFKFKVGMEFSSLKQFKKVVLEHNVLNGRDVRFSRIDETRVVVDKLKNNSGMKLNEVVADVRLGFAIEITRCRAFKTRQLARKVVEGDSAKKDSMLWSYGVELRRAS